MCLLFVVSVHCSRKEMSIKTRSLTDLFCRASILLCMMVVKPDETVLIADAFLLKYLPHRGLRHPLHEKYAAILVELRATEILVLALFHEEIGNNDP